MRLRISTPVAAVLDAPDIVAVRAEDASGSFGILDGHADFLTVLAITVVSFRHAGGRQEYCAVRRGVLTVRGGQEISIATPEAVLGEDPLLLARDVLAKFRAAAEEEETARALGTRLHVRAIRQILHYLEPERAPKLGD